MGIVQLVLVVLVLAFGAKLWSKYEHAAQEAGIAKAEKQLADSALEAERDTKRETAAIIAKRPLRIKAQAARRDTRKAADEAQRKIDPVYLKWADELVPMYVIDRLRANADVDQAIRGSAGDGEPVAPVQAEGAATAGADGKFSVGAIRRIFTRDD